MRAAPGPMHHQSIAPAPRGTASHGGLGGERGAAGAGTRTPRGNQGARGTEGAGGSLRDHGGYGGCRLRCAGRARSRSRPRTEAAVHPIRREAALPPTANTLTTDRPPRPTGTGHFREMRRDSPPSLRVSEPPAPASPAPAKALGAVTHRRSARGEADPVASQGPGHTMARGRPGSRSSSRARTAHRPRVRLPLGVLTFTSSASAPSR